MLYAVIIAVVLAVLGEAVRKGIWLVWFIKMQEEQRTR